MYVSIWTLCYYHHIRKFDYPHIDMKNKYPLSFLYNLPAVLYYFIILIFCIAISTIAFWYSNFYFYYQTIENFETQRQYFLTELLESELDLIHFNSCFYKPNQFIRSQIIDNNKRPHIELSCFDPKGDGWKVENFKESDLDHTRTPIHYSKVVFQNYRAKMVLNINNTIRPPFLMHAYRAWTFSYKEFLENSILYVDRRLYLRSAPLYGLFIFFSLILFKLSSLARRSYKEQKRYAAFLAKKVKQEKEYNEYLQQQLVDSQDKFYEACKEKNKYKEQIDNAKIQQNRIKNELKGISDRQAEITRYKKDPAQQNIINSLNQEVEQLNQRKNQLIKEKNEQEQQIADLLQKLNDSEQLSSQYERENKLLQQEIDEKEKRTPKYDDEFLTKLKNSIQKLREDKNELMKENKELKEDRRKLNKENKELKEKISEDHQFKSASNVFKKYEHEFIIYDGVWDKAKLVILPGICNALDRRLQTLISINDRLINGQLGKPLFEVFKEELSDQMFSLRESETTMNAFSDVRRFTHRGQQKYMEIHFKFAEGIRMYFTFDAESEKVHIGYFGPHLKTHDYK